MKYIPFNTLSRRRQEIFDICHEYALMSDMRTKHSACIVRNGKIVEICHNTYDVKKSSAHAEENVLKKMDNKRNNLIKKNHNYDLYVIRYSTKNGYMNSKPCNSCVKLIKRRMPYVKRIFYSNDNQTFICEEKDDLKNTHITCGAKHRKYY